MSSETSESSLTDYEPRRIKNWLDLNIRSELTKASYYSALKSWIVFKYGRENVSDYSGRFFKHSKSDKENRVKRDKENRLLEIEDGVERYFNELDDVNFLDDFKKFIIWLGNEGYASLTITTYVSSVKIFFRRQDNRCTIIDDDWKQIKNNLLPQSKRAATQDEILTKEQLKVLLIYMPIHLKAMTLFLLSSGVRIGAACQLVMEDLHLDDDPPWVNVREKYTKRGLGGRYIWMSNEAGEALREWHIIRQNKKKAVGRGEKYEDYDENSVFNYTDKNFRRRYNLILKKVDAGNKPPVYDRRDPSTKRRIRIYHVHTLRKFFRTSMGMGGVPDMLVHAWMGHNAYLDEYDKMRRPEMTQVYQDNMHHVTIYEKSIDEQANEKAVKAMKEAKESADQIKVQAAFINNVGAEMDAFAGMSEAQIKVMSGEDKLVRIMKAYVQQKADTERVLAAALVGSQIDQGLDVRNLLSSLNSLTDRIDKLEQRDKDSLTD